MAEVPYQPPLASLLSQDAAGNDSHTFRIPHRHPQKRIPCAIPQPVQIQIFLHFSLLCTSDYNTEE